MAVNGNYAQRWITAVDEIRSGGEIVDNLAGMSEAIGLLAGDRPARAGKLRLAALSIGRSGRLARARVDVGEECRDRSI